MTKNSFSPCSMSRIFFMGFMFAHGSMGALYSELSSLERSIVDEGLAIYGLMPEEAPEGKIVKKIYVITSSPFSADSGLLTLLNYLHINTKEDIIRRELFQKEGVIYEQALVRDSELALRGQSLVRSVAVIVPVRGINDPINGEISLLVATRDLLSLRPTFNFQGNVGTITNFMVALGENNLLGYNKAIAGIYEMQQSGHILSARYFDPRLLGSRLQLTAKPGFIFARDSLKFDGILGDLKIEKPLLSEMDRWGYGIDVTYGSKAMIDFNGAKVRMVDIMGTGGLSSFERRYRWRYGKGSVFGRYSFGRTHKREVFLSYNVNVKRPSIPDELNLDEEQKEIFRANVLPKNELESYVTLGFAYFQNNYLTLYDYDNYKLQESKRTGPQFSISNDFSSKQVLFSDNSFLRPELKLSHLQALGTDSFVNASIKTSNRYDGDFTDNLYKFGLTIVSPKVPNLGRMIVDGRISTVYDNRDNQKFVLGSDNGLRGVESRRYSGEGGFRTNFELRTLPVDLWIFHAGLAIFYDVGAAYDSILEANATHAVGFGLRVLAPQVSSELFRLDFAFPIFGLGKYDHIVVPSFGTGQAF